MTTQYQRIRSFLQEILGDQNLDELAKRLASRPGDRAPKVPKGAEIRPELVEQRWQLLGARPEARELLLDPKTAEQMACYQRNIENFIGTVKVPIGLAGPLRVNGLFAHGDYYVPLATTEAALVASYNRGAQLISEVGGCSALILNEGVSRAPGFAFRDLKDAGLFLIWATSQFETFCKVAASTTRYGKLADMKATLEGNHVYLEFLYTVGDGSGQNMVTIATQAIVDYISENAPIHPEYFFVEANLSGDKKASLQSFQAVRGKKVSAEVMVPADLVQEHLHTTTKRMVDYWRISAVGGVLSGTMGVHGHYANGLAAIYLACGQDVACVAESAVGVTRFEAMEDSTLYASVTLPNLIVGTIGGGTGLPSQHACLELLGLAGPGKARAFAEVCAALALAGEISIAGALCAGDFTRAHQSLARGG